MGSLKGIVVDENHNPVYEASVLIVAGPSHNDLALLSDEGGHFDFGNVAPGKYKLRAVAGIFQSADVPVTVTGNQKVTIKIQIQRSSSPDAKSSLEFKSYPFDSDALSNKDRNESSSFNEIDEI